MRSAFLAILLVGGCEGPTGADTAPPTFGSAPFLSVDSDAGLLHVEVRCDPQPPEVGVAAFQYVVTDPEGGPVDQLAIAVVPWMPEMGMGASVEPTIVDQGDGVYEVDDVDLVMSGMWELRTTFTGSVSDSVDPSFEVP